MTDGPLLGLEAQIRDFVRCYPNTSTQQIAVFFDCDPDVVDGALSCAPAGWTDEGVKHDEGKPRYDLTPPEVEDAIAKVLTFGAAKYGDRNWERGMKWGRPYAALRRHMAAWWGGEGTDDETGYSHLWHAACCIAFLIAFEARGAGTDDRPGKNE